VEKSGEMSAKIANRLDKSTKNLIFAPAKIQKQLTQ
jgi:hypothetical protein